MCAPVYDPRIAMTKYIDLFFKALLLGLIVPIFLVLYAAGWLMGDW